MVRLLDRAAALQAALHVVDAPRRVPLRTRPLRSLQAGKEEVVTAAVRDLAAGWETHHHTRVVTASERHQVPVTWAVALWTVFRRDHGDSPEQAADRVIAVMDHGWRKRSSW